MPTNKSVKQDEYKQTRQLVKSLINTFPQYKNYKEQDFIDMLEKISAVESRNKNVKQLEGGPGRGYFQMELRSAPISKKRAENTLNALKERGVKIPKLPRFSEDFTQLSKDEQAFYVVNNLIGAAGSKREQGQKDYYLNPTKPKDVWTDLHWAGKDKDKPARVKHWEEIHGKDQQPVAQEMPQAPPSEIGWSDIAKTYLQFPMAPQFAAGMAYTKLFGPEQSEVEVPEQQASGGLIKRKDGSYSKRGLWDNIRANRGSGRKPTAEMLRQERKIRAAEKKEDGGWLDAYDDGGPIYNWIPEKYPRVGARYGDGSWVADSSIPTPTTPSYYPATGVSPMMSNRQMGNRMSKLPDGKIVDSSPEIPAYAYGGMIPKYAAGATVWTDQDTPLWAAGTPTRTTTQMITQQKAQSPGTQVPYPEIKITGPTNPYAPSSNVMNQKPVQPYKKMRLHAPTTTVISKSPGSYGRMHALGGAVGAPFHHGDVLSKKNTYNHGFANGGYVPMYKSGGFFRQAGEFAFGALEGTLDTVTGGLTDSLTDMGHDALAQAAGTTYEGKEGQRLKRLHGAGKIGGAIAGGIASGNVAGAIGQGAEGTNDILQASPNASDDLKQWGGFGLNLAQTASGFMGGGQGSMGNLNNADKMAAFGKSGIGQFSQQAGKIGQGYNQYGSMLSNPLAMLGMPTGGYAQGGHITKKYNPPGLRYQALNPGVSDPSGMYVGPTTQRGITFADGGPVTFSFAGENHKVYIKKSPTGIGKGIKGHVMVNHPTEDKGKWDTIDLTEKAGAKTVAQGVAATKKWHRENPTYANGGPIYNWIPNYPKTAITENKKKSGGWLDNMK